MSETRDPIEYLLNAMENAATSKDPYEYGYAMKRRAVLNAITTLRCELAAATAERDAYKVQLDIAIAKDLTLGDVARAILGLLTYEQVTEVCKRLEAYERAAGQEQSK